MLENFFSLFKTDVTVINDSKKRREDTIDQLVSRHSNGNVNLQQAKYITEKMLKEKQSSLFSYKFA